MLHSPCALFDTGLPTNSASRAKLNERTTGMTMLSDVRTCSWLPVSESSKVGSSITLLANKYRFTLLSMSIRAVLTYIGGVNEM